MLCTRRLYKARITLALRTTRLRIAGIILLVCAGLASQIARAALSFVPSSVIPPTPLREFRGVWIASVGNLDWPSKAGLPTETQKTELVAMLEKAASLKFNAVVFQVRPNCDALYDSKIEPWSEYLTGKMGQAPQPYYDPLAFAVDEAHKRGLELHAWFNPFRALHSSAKSPAAANHVSKTQPSLVRQFGKFLWLDPGEPAVHDYSLKVILDVVHRYDIDGVHIDDYFYPYPDPNNKSLDFPDDGSWHRYVKGGGKLDRDDWRRENVNRFVQRLYQEIKAEKPAVKFGISPFGIWRPNNPAGVRGMDSFQETHADSRKWLANGWLDYFSPQLYWTIGAPAQSFPALLKWWTEQNVKGRHLWPGIADDRIGNDRSAAETINEIKATRSQAGAGGNIHWSIKALMRDSDRLDETLPKEVYATPALVPASPWLAKKTLSKPQVHAEPLPDSWKFRWYAAPGETAAKWIVQAKIGNEWTLEVLPSNRAYMTLTKSTPTVVAITAVDRAGNAGPAAVVELRDVGKH